MTTKWRRLTVCLWIIGSLLSSCGPGQVFGPRLTPTPTSAPMPALQPDKSRYLADLQFIAQAPRGRGMEHHTAVQELCASRFAELGYTVERQTYDSGINVLGTLPGISRPDEMVIMSAHYDSLPAIIGADDNASGAAAVLESARLLAAEKHDRTLVVACWDEEEIGKVGSREYAARAKAQNAKIIVAYVYDEIGYVDDEPNSQHMPDGFELVYPDVAQKLKANDYRANFVALIFDKQAQPMEQAIAQIVEQAGVPAVSVEVDLGGKVPYELTTSDHGSFWDKGYSAIEINDTAGYRNPFKHSTMDTVERLNPDFSIKIIAGVATSAQDALKASGK
jgi:Zn-dependent M28 family amino/carboxypeptidase